MPLKNEIIKEIQNIQQVDELSGWGFKCLGYVHDVYPGSLSNKWYWIWIYEREQVRVAFRHLGNGWCKYVGGGELEELKEMEKNKNFLVHPSN